MAININNLLIYLFFTYLSVRPGISQNFDVNTPLFITPFLEHGMIAEARERARVRLREMGNIESYSGYLTVNKTYNSNLFFWYFPSKGNSPTDPLILWLQGGPGTPSFAGIFNEHGPFIITKSNTLELRGVTWLDNHQVLYIDNPVGTGYSFTENEAGYATSANHVALNLYTALQQFFSLFPELRVNDFYAMGESYAGKYIPALTYAIHQSNENLDINKRINLVGIAIGNGWTDPINQMEYSEYMYQIGLLDEPGRDQFRVLEEEVKGLLREEKYTEAKKVYDVLIRGLVAGETTVFQNLTGFRIPFNLLETEGSARLSRYDKWVQQPSIRRAIHVGNNEFFARGSGSRKVDRFLNDDFLRSVAGVVEVLLEHYRVLLFFGQLDISVPMSASRGYLQNLRWSGSEEYKNAVRNRWYVKNELAGYTKCARNLTEVLIRNAGHFVPIDQPFWTWSMISDFTRYKSLC